MKPISGVTHFFNPENDLALAVGPKPYTPPKAAVALREACSELPLWWADEGDAVLVSGDEAAERAISLKQSYGLAGEIVTAVPEGSRPDPWGWSAHTRRLLAARGASTNLMPDDATLARLRQVSHRRTAVAVHRLLGTDGRLMPVEADSVALALDTVDRFGRAVIKLPWSSSGRGILYSASMPRAILGQQIEGMIRRQGSVTVEPMFDRISDFAALFYIRDSRAEYRGMSAFATDGRGSYAGNIAADQQTIIRHAGFDAKCVASDLAAALDKVVSPYYTGWAGVDMLTYLTGRGTVALAPCIEVNLRRTMGVAALEISRHIDLSAGPRLLRATMSGVELSEHSIKQM